jgi:hypothetical protein
LYARFHSLSQSFQSSDGFIPMSSSLSRSSLERICSSLPIPRSVWMNSMLARISPITLLLKLSRSIPTRVAWASVVGTFELWKLSRYSRFSIESSLLQYFM